MNKMTVEPKSIEGTINQEEIIIDKGVDVMRDKTMRVQKRKRNKPTSMFVTDKIIKEVVIEIGITKIIIVVATTTSREEEAKKMKKTLNMIKLLKMMVIKVKVSKDIERTIKIAAITATMIIVNMIKCLPNMIMVLSYLSLLMVLSSALVVSIEEDVGEEAAVTEVVEEEVIKIMTMATNRIVKTIREVVINKSIVARTSKMEVTLKITRLQEDKVLKPTSISTMIKINNIKSNLLKIKQLKYQSLINKTQCLIK